MKILFTFALILIIAGNLLPQNYNSDGYTGKIHPINPTGKIVFAHAYGDTIFSATYIKRFDNNNFLEFSASFDNGATWKQKQFYVKFDDNNNFWTPG